MNQVKKILKRGMGLLIFNIFLSAAATICSLLGPYLVGRAVDSIPSIAVAFGEFQKNCLMLLLIYLLSAGLTYLFTVCSYRYSQNVTAGLRRAIFAKLYDVPIKAIDNTPFGQTMSLMLNDTENVAEGVFQLVTTLFGGVVMVIGTIYIMISLNWRIGLMIMLVTPLSVLLSMMIARVSRRHFKTHQANMANLGAQATEHFSNQKLLLLNNNTQAGAADFDDVNSALYDSYKNSMFISAIPNPSSRVVNYIAYALTGVMGMFLSVPVGSITALLLYANQFNKPFNDFTSVVTQLQAASASLRRITAFLDEPDQQDSGTDTLPDGDGHIEFKDVSFSYNDAPFLSHLNLDVESGQRIAIVGPTGSGKTTLINLIMRFYEPDGGAILFDGKDIRNIPRKLLRERIGMVLQDSFLFNGTIAENIAYGREDITREAIIDAAKRAYCHHFIESLPEGYDTVVRGDSDAVSEGQKQLICIARVMAKLPPVLMLDEATSNIDTRTEALIQKALANIMKGRTTFVIAHRLSTIKDSQRILVVKSGNIIEQGTHDELMAKDSFYRELYQSQYEEV